MTLVLISQETESPAVDWGGTTATLRIYASTSFYSSENVYVNAGRVGTNEWCQSVDCTITDGIITIDGLSLYSTTDSSVPNATYTAVFFDSAGRKRTTKLSQFFVDPNGLQVTAQSSVNVTLAGSSGVNGLYTFRGYHSGRPYYNLESFADSITLNAVIAGTGNPYVILDSTGQLDYICLTTTNYPWEDIYDVQDGDAPAPAVTENVNTISTTWEAITLSNASSIAMTFFNNDTWPVAIIKGYVQSVIANGANAFANQNVIGSVYLDVDPAVATLPIAVGVNSPLIPDISGLQAQIDSLNTLKAPKATPSFTGIVTSAGNIVGHGTIAVDGNITGANLSGVNTGDQHTFTGGTPASVTDLIQVRRGLAATWTGANPTLSSGEFGYETDTGKFKIGDGTTNWVSLAYTTGTITLTGNVTGSGAGSIATTIANGVVTNAMLAGGITAANLAGSIPFTKLVGSDIVITESQVTNLVSDLALKANLISPSFTTPALGTITAGVLTAGTTATQANGTSDTTLASTAFVQGLGVGVKRYEATLTQTSTNAPTAQVLVNTLGMTLNWGYTSAGHYSATAASGTPFTLNKTQIFVGNCYIKPALHDIIIHTTRTSTTVISVQVTTTGVADSDDTLQETAFTILVYP